MENLRGASIYVMAGDQLAEEPRVQGEEEAGPPLKRARRTPKLWGLREELIARRAQINSRTPVSQLTNSLIFFAAAGL